MNYIGILIRKSVLAGIFISMGSIAYAMSPNSVVGALLFSTGLVGIIILDGWLYTGKVGYVDTWEDLFALMLCLLTNVVTCTVIGIFISKYCPDIGAQVLHISANKEAKGDVEYFIGSILCGVLIHGATSLYKKTHKIVGVILCVMTFILAGFEHSIANTFYFTVSKIESGSYLVALAILGNALGGKLTNLLLQE